MPSTVRRSATAPQPSDLLLALYPLALVLLTLAALVAPQREGPLALAQVFAHFLFLPALLLVPLAPRRGRFLLRLALVAAAASFLLVYPPALRLGAPAAPATPELTILQWNLYVGGVPPSELRRAMEQYRPDVVTLQESDWEAIADDSAILAEYPYRLLDPASTAPGLAILSRLPIVESGVPQRDDAAWDMPRIVWARLDLEGRTVTVVNTHPIPPRTFDETCDRPNCYNNGPRDAQIADLRRFVEQLHRRTGDPLLLAGDMNVSEREPAYFVLSAGLQDAQRVAGSGFGASWRPAALGLPLGLIRIDYLFSDAQLRPLRLSTDCASRSSDHCLLVGRFALASPPIADSR